MNVALLFPGQGSQQVGMGAELAAQFPAARVVFEEADNALGFSLSRLCFAGPSAELSLTEHTQPAILTTSIAVWRVLASEFGAKPVVTLGHSLGEYSALVAAGALTFGDAVKLVRLRGRAMQEAVAPGAGAMAALLGAEERIVDEVCAEAAQGEVVSPANFNGGGQIVIAGAKAAVDRAIVIAKARGIKRAVLLQVSAPFHCALMQPAAARLAEALGEIAVGEMLCPVIANVDAEPNSDPTRVRALLVEQVTAPVRFEACVRRLGELLAGRSNVSLLELGAGSVLAGLVKRIAADLIVTSVESPDSVAALRGGDE